MATVNAHLVWPLLVRPTLSALHKQNSTVARNLAIALGNAENADPGFLLELINAIQKKDCVDPSTYIDSVQLTECLLRAQGRLSAEDLKTPTNNGNLDPRIQQLTERTATLKKLLSRIPNEISQRAAFLQTIKEIASAIKKILDSLDLLIAESAPSERRSLEQRKRQLVKNSKQFSQTLKCHFKGSQEAGELYSTSAQLIYDVNLINKVCTKST